MSEKKEYAPTDTAKLLEWLANQESKSLMSLEKSLKGCNYSLASTSETYAETYRIVGEHVLQGEFIPDEKTQAKAPLQVLAEIWDRWKAHLLDNEFIWDHRQEMPHVVYDITYAHSYRHNMATQLALAVHLEIDGTVGSDSRHSLQILDSGKLEYVNSNLSIPRYLQYKSPKEAWRACKLLQPVARELFFVFEDATPKQGKEE